jgi:hypothetical protein
MNKERTVKAPAIYKHLSIQRMEYQIIICIVLCM